VTFIKIGTHILNLSQIAWVELIEGGFGKRIEVYFVGGEKLDLHGDEGLALVATLHASEVDASPR
jgi:hypothetical protein